MASCSTLFSSSTIGIIIVPSAGVVDSVGPCSIGYSAISSVFISCGIVVIDCVSFISLVLLPFLFLSFRLIIIQMIISPTNKIRPDAKYFA